MIRTIGLVILLLVLTLPAQSHADSQFAANGLGVSSLQSHGRGWAMGGISYALTDSIRVSFANPALPGGFKKVSMSILYAAEQRRAEDPEENVWYNASTFPYFAFLVPFNDRFAVGFGYNQEQDLSTARTVTGTIDSLDAPPHTRLFDRSGSVFRVPGVVSIRLLDDWRLGFRLDSYFANTEEEFVLSFDDDIIRDTDERDRSGGKGTGVAFGTIVPLSRYGHLGVTWSSGAVIEGDREIVGENGTISKELFKLDYPARLAAGATVGNSSGWTASGEIVRSFWEDVDNPLTPLGGYQDVTELGFGIERSGRKTADWHSRLPYRLGFRTAPLSYLDAAGNEIDTWSVMGGTSLVLGRDKGRLDITYEYGHMGDVDEIGLRENYHRIVIGFSGQESWRKRKSYIE